MDKNGLKWFEHGSTFKLLGRRGVTSDCVDVDTDWNLVDVKYILAYFLHNVPFVKYV